MEEETDVRPVYGVWDGGRWGVTADGVPAHLERLCVARALAVNMNIVPGRADWRAMRIGADGQPEEPENERD